MRENTMPGYTFNTCSDSEVLDRKEVVAVALDAGFTHFKPQNGKWRPLEEFGWRAGRFRFDYKEEEINLILGEENLIYGSYPLSRQPDTT